MRLATVLTIYAVAGVCSHAALVTQHQDVDLAAPTVNGVISPDEYGPGNSYSFTGGGAGFGGQLGPATMYMKSDVTNLFIAFSGLAVPLDLNRYIVYIHTRAGGFQPNGEMTDASDTGRSNVTFLTSGGKESLTFEEGGISNSPDFALFMYNNPTGFQSMVELHGAGQLHAVVLRTSAGLGTSTVEFRIPRSSLGLSISGAVDFAAVELSASGYMSNEGIPLTGLATNIGFGVGQTNFLRDFHRFIPTSLAPTAGLTQRVANTTLRMPAAAPADSGFTYTTADAFPGVTMSYPVAMASPPGETNRLFVVEQIGRIWVITNLANPNLTLFMNIASRVSTLGGLGAAEGGLLGLAFHPGYATNRYFFVDYTSSGTTFDRVARYQTQAGNPNAGDTNSETLFISQLDEYVNHNGGDLHFDTNGYLFITIGDEGGCNDSGQNSQRIDKDFFSAILRIDVDKKPGSLSPNPHTSIGTVTNYAIPPDNPFIGATQFIGSAVNSNSVRTEFYAVGLRNPFRISFDELTGELYAGDVGQDAREEVDYIIKGRNYGWKFREGSIATPENGSCGTIGSPPAGFTNIVSPIADYQHGAGQTNGFCITGGRVYRGDRFSDLVGKYIFCDFITGNMWMLSPNGTNRMPFTYMLTDDRISTYGRDPRNGDLLMCEHATNGFVKRLERVIATNALPATLADTGAFADLPTLTPYPGIVPYELNVPFWSDGAIKSRWFSIPGTNQTIAFDATQPWTSPTGSVWVKHFELVLTNGVDPVVRRLETRLLVKNSDGSGGYGVTYRWGTSTTNALLVQSSGFDESFTINDGGTIRTQVWHYPARSECLQCHQSNPGFSLGFNTVQLNREHDYSGSVSNQIQALNGVGYFQTNVTGFNLLGKLAQATNTAYSVDYRARSYLQANCRQCHYPGPAIWDARIATPLSLANIVNGPLNNNFGSTNNRVIVPGSLTNSVLHSRINTRGASQMPPLASNLVDTQGVAIVAAWITTTLTNYQTYAEWQNQHFGSTTNVDGLADADPDHDGNNNNTEFLTGTDPTNLVVDDAWTMNVRVTNDMAQVVYPRIANRFFDVQVTTDVVDGAWQSMDVPANAPFAAAATATAVVPDPDSTNSPSSFYRARISEP